MKREEKYNKELINILQRVSTDRILLREFLVDLLSPKEYHEIITRWQIVKQLAKGIPQRKIAKNLKVSIATVGRGSRELLDKNGGFWKALKISSKTK